MIIPETSSVASSTDLAVFTPALERLRQESETHFGMAAPRFHVEWRQSRMYSEIIRVLVSEGDRSVRVFIKVARVAGGSAEQKPSPQNISRAFDTMLELHQKLAGVPGLSVVKPVACFPEHLTIVTEKAKGLTVLQLLDSNGRWWPPEPVRSALNRSFARVGEWVRHFQRVAADSRTLSLAGMREYIDFRLRILAEPSCAALTPAERQRLLAAFDARTGRLTTRQMPDVAVHADFAPGNILVDGDNIVVLDFGVPLRGSAVHDVAHLYMQLGLFSTKPQFRSNLIRGLQRSLLHGYDPALEPDEPLFELLLFQHVVCHFAGLVKRPAGPMARAYNWFLQRRHKRWLDAFADVR